MAKYLVTSGSHFTPFTYDELVRPLQQMTEAHQATQEQYDALGSAAASLANYISDNPNDNEAKAMYDNYMTLLNNAANELNDRGYSQNAARALSQARMGYAKDITRIDAAVKARAAASSAYWKAKHDHPDMIMSKDPGTFGLNDYLHDVNKGNTWYAYSGNQFAEEVGAEVKAAAAQMLERPDVQRDPRLVGYLEVYKRDGFTNTQVDNAAKQAWYNLQHPDAKTRSSDLGENIIADILERRMASTGAHENVSSDEYERLFNYGMMGARSGVGKTDVSYKEDIPYKYAMDLAAERQKAAIKAAANGDVPIPAGVTIPGQVKTDEKLRRKSRSIKSDLSLIEHIQKNPSLEISQEQRDLANEAKIIRAVKYPPSMGRNDVDYATSKKYADIIERHPELEDMSEDELTATILAGTDHKAFLQQMRDRYAHGENVSVDDLHKLISEEQDKLVLAENYTKINTQNTKWISGLVEDSIAGVANQKGGRKGVKIGDIATNMSTGKPMKKDELQEYLNVSDATYAINPNDGSVVLMTDLEHPTVRLNPDVFGGLSISPIYRLSDADPRYWNAEQQNVYFQLGRNRELAALVCDYLGSRDISGCIKELPVLYNGLREAAKSSDFVSNDDARRAVSLVQQLVCDYIRSSSNAFIKERGATGDKD